MAEPGSESQLGRPLLAAKCAIPPSRPVGVVRNRLHEKLLYNAATRLTVVVAPAGWGKTTLLSQWAHDPAEHRRVAWVSLDESDDDPIRFWTYVLTALRPHESGGAPAGGARGTRGRPVDVALPLLLNELESRSSRRPGPRRLPRAHRPAGARGCGVLARLPAALAAPGRGRPRRPAASAAPVAGPR